MKKFLAVILSLLMIVTCFTACGDTKEPEENNTTTSSGIEGVKKPQESLEGVKHASFEKFTAVDLAGNTVDESIFKGKKLTMINIWATFCRPCIGEMPDLEWLSKKYADKGVQVMGIVCDVSYSGDGYEPSLYDAALAIVEDTGVTYTSLLPSDSLDMIKLSEVYSVPETIFVDENGKIVGESFIGSRSFEDWKAIVDSILANME